MKKKSNAGIYFNEVSILKIIKSNKIVSILDSFQDEENGYIVMPFCEGGECFKFANNLNFRYLKNLSNSSIDIFKYWAITFQILCSLLSTERHKVVHRDIKLGNYFISKNLQIILGDFGYAKHLEDLSSDSRSELVGSPNYCSPEVVQSNEYSLRSDVWAFGILLFYLKCGFAPFEGQSTEKTLLNILSFEKRQKKEDDHKSIRNLKDLKIILKNYSKIKFDFFEKDEEGDLLEELLDQLIYKCLSRDPKSRPLASDMLFNQKNGFFNLSKFIFESNKTKFKEEDIKLLETCIKDYENFKRSNQISQDKPTIQITNECSKQIERSISTIENSKEIISKDFADDLFTNFNNLKRRIKKLKIDLSKNFLNKITSKQHIDTEKLSLIFSSKKLNLSFKKSKKSLDICYEQNSLDFCLHPKNSGPIRLKLTKKTDFFWFKETEYKFQDITEIKTFKVIKMCVKILKNITDTLNYLKNLVPIIDSQLVDHEIIFPNSSNIKFFRALNSDQIFLFITEKMINFEKIVSLFLHGKSNIFMFNQLIYVDFGCNREQKLIDKVFNQFQIYNSDPYFVSFDEKTKKLTISPSVAVEKKRQVVKVIDFLLKNI